MLRPPPTALVSVGESPAASAPATAADSVATPAIYVHVHGAVATPGLYRVSAEARVVDAVAAAGGLTEQADPAGENLARRVSDGEKIYLPRQGEIAPTTPSSGGDTTVGAPAKINLNTADLAALESLPRIGPALAQRIIDWRTQNGPFGAVDDLLAVPGIGERLLAGLADLVSV